jgi:catechol 2,3-dioxygenase-like lactoylglutathione lyase family enzyme
MIDHITFGVVDIGRSTAFYDRALAPLGMRRLVDVPKDQTDGVNVTGYGDDHPWFWLAEENATTGMLHVALRAHSRADVDAFHAAALAAGGTDNGAAGLRPHYHPDYYAAFVLDPDGHNIEAVCHDALTRGRQHLRPQSRLQVLWRAAR